MKKIPLEQQLCFSLYSVNLAVNKIYKPILDKADLTYPQYLVLSTLWENDALNNGVIAKRLGLEASTITPIVKRLEKLGHISRLKDPQSDRKVIVSLTKTGKQLKKEMTCLPYELLESSGFDVSELTELNEKIKLLSEALLDSAKN